MGRSTVPALLDYSKHPQKISAWMAKIFIYLKKIYQLHGKSWRYMAVGIIYSGIFFDIPLHGSGAG